jgi:hypothetical protein
MWRVFLEGGIFDEWKLFSYRKVGWKEEILGGLFKLEIQSVLGKFYFFLMAIGEYESFGFS